MSSKEVFYKTKLTKELDYNQMCYLVQEGKTDSEIAEMYFVHSSTVYRLRKKWGIHKPENPTKYNWEFIKRMLECNLTYEDIAYIYGGNTKKQHIAKFVLRQKKKGSN